jgi:hypothetical protein
MAKETLAVEISAQVAQAVELQVVRSLHLMADPAVVERRALADTETAVPMVARVLVVQVKITTQLHIHMAAAVAVLVITAVAVVVTIAEADRLGSRAVAVDRHTFLIISFHQLQILKVLTVRLVSWQSLSVQTFRRFQLCKVPAI